MNSPAIILVEPQLSENIGMAVRAMANWGLSDLRLVAPRDGWPQPAAVAAAVGAVPILEAARVFPTVADAIAGLHYVLATTARPRGQMKRVFGPEDAMAGVTSRISAGQGVGILFGRERTGLENDDISFADAIVTFPVDAALPSLNLAQAVSLLGYEWRRAATKEPTGPAELKPVPATREAVLALFEYMEAALDEAGYYPPDKRPIMARNMRDMFYRMTMSEQDVRTWRGAVRALAEGRLRKGKGVEPS